MLARYSRRVVVNYDPDSAGVAATERSLALLLEEGFEAKVLALPGGLDPDSFVRKQGMAAYRQLLATAPTYIDYLTESALATHGTETPEARVAVANAIAPYVAKVPNSMLRGDLANRLATRLRIDDRLVREELMRAALRVARAGVAEGGSPFGACVVRAGAIVACEHNRVLQTTDSTAHAEIAALRAACKRLVVSPDFYEAMERPNVELVTSDIARVEPEGVRTVDGVGSVLTKNRMEGTAEARLEDLAALAGRAP